MKINHTPLGVLSSHGKVAAGLAALALIGGITPLLIKETHALVDSGPSTSDMVYTTVGPDYFTLVNEVEDYWYDDYSVRVADPDVADFYYDKNLPKAQIEGNGKKGVGDRSYYPLDKNDCRRYNCLQGKKIGTTEIIIEKEGEDTIRIPVTSVKLTPDASNYSRAGIVLKHEGSIEGADNNLLVLQEIFADEVVDYSINSDRGYSLFAHEDSSNLFSGFAELVWTIGNQQVGGGTRYVFMDFNGIDNILDSDLNKSKLGGIYFDVIDTMMRMGGFSDESKVITTEKGNIFRLNEPTIDDDDILRPESMSIVLDSTPVSLNEVAKKQFTSKLPNNVKQVEFRNINAKINECAYVDYGGRIIDRGGNDTPISKFATSDPDYSGYPIECECVADILSTPEIFDMALDVSGAKAVKDGYARKWYVVRENNGNIEAIDATYDEATDTIRFASSILGNYAYGYVDEKIEPSAPKVPNTGVAQKQIATTAAATILPLLGIAGIAFMIRSKKHADNKLAKKHNHFE